MTTLLIANNCARENGSFMGDQLCALKTAYLFVANTPGVDRVVMSMSPGNEMDFLWHKFVDDPRGDGSLPRIEVVWDAWHPGDWEARFVAWNRWRAERVIESEATGTRIEFDHYRELYLRIHGAQRQTTICGSERGLGRRNIYEYWLAGQEDRPDMFPGADRFDDTLIYHPPLTRERDVYISPHCKTQGNITFTFDYWSQVVHRLIDAGITVTVGYNGPFCEDLNNHPLYHKHWGDHRQWMEQVCRHKLVACGNTGTGWLAAACGVPMITMEPHNSQMPDHRYRECGLANLVEVVDGYRLDELGNDMTRVAGYVAGRIIDEVNRKVVMTTGCYDVLHAGHVRHLERARAMGTRLIVALNSDESVRGLKGPHRPINPQDQRRAVLEALRCVDEVRLFDGPDARPLIEEIRPDVLACGYGYARDEIVGRELLEAWGGAAAITCHGDAKDEPSTTKVVQRALRSGDVIEVCRIGASYSVNPFEKLKLMADEFLKVAHLPGDVADLGTYRGGSALILRRLAPERHLHCFDTWEGNPHDDELCHHRRGEWATSLEDCQRLVGTDERTHYHRGVFPHVSAENSTWGYAEFCFAYVDMDTYQATRDAIQCLWKHLVPGGKLFIDDYGWEPCAGVRVAVDEAFTEGERSDDGILVDVVAGSGFRRRVVQSQYACIVEKS